MRGIEKLTRRNFLRTIGVGSLTGAVLEGKRAQASISTDLGFKIEEIPKDDDSACCPIKINNDGTVFGWYWGDKISPFNRKYFLYKSGTVRRLNFEVVSEFYPTGINDIGDLVVGQTYLQRDGSLVYKVGEKEPISLDFFASDINDKDIIGYVAYDRGGFPAYRSYKYNLETGEQVELGEFKAVAIDKQGRIAGDVEDENGATAIIWKDGKITELERYCENSIWGVQCHSCYAKDISESVIIGSIRYPRGYGGCMWDEDGKITKLPFIAIATNNLGQILGEADYFYYAGEIIRLRNFTNIEVCIDINDKEQVICTMGAGSGKRGLILTPIYPQGDLSRDGRTDFKDVSVIGTNWLKTSYVSPKPPRGGTR